MQFPKLTPLQSRFVASFAASLLLVIFYLALSNPHFAYASDVESIAHKDYNHPLSLGVTVPEEDLEGLEDDREGRPPRYEPEFAALGRSIIGRAPDTESPQSLSNNAPGKQNIAQGGSQFWVFPKAALSGPLASTIPVLPSEFGKRNITPWSERQEDDIGGPELKGRQAEGSTLYVTLNTCDQPSASAGSPAAAPLQLRLFVSQSVQNPGPNTPTLAIREVEVNQGFGTYQVSPISDDFYLGVFAPPDSSGFTGNYSYEITASIDASYTSYKEQPSLYLVDSDTNAGLLVSNNITTANETDPQYKQWMNARPPFGIFIHNQNDSSIRGLERSLCGLKNHAQIQGNIPGMDSTKVEVGMTTIGGGKPKQQFYVQGLNGSSSYYAIMVIGSEYSTSGPANVGGGGAVWTAANFSTKSDGNCQVIYNLTFCPQVSYAVPSNPKFFPNATSLATWYDTNARNAFRNFSYSLQQIPCDTTPSAQYSLAVNCSTCNASYHDWLCAVTMPRCMDFTIPDAEKPYLLPRNVNSSFIDASLIPSPVLNDPVFSTANKSVLYLNSSRNPLIDQFVSPGPYKELLPCTDLCHGLVRACPASLGFACPFRGKGLEHSYGDMTVDEAGDVMCSMPGAIWGVSAASALSGPGLGRLVLLLMGWAGFHVLGGFGGIAWNA